ncbi:MAG: hypothetical protein KAR25_04035 [Methanosarcinales archaeon]|nr:hypothetical protein [Methanosarcinales archaeon]
MGGHNPDDSAKKRAYPSSFDHWVAAITAAIIATRIPLRAYGDRDMQKRNMFG